MLLEANSDVEVVGEAESAREALHVVSDANPDVIILDLNLGEGMTGPEVLPLLRNLCPDAKVLVISAYSDPVVHEEIRTAGADAFIPKQNIRQLVTSVQAFIEAVDDASP